jgi:hypothetical protein
VEQVAPGDEVSLLSCSIRASVRVRVSGLGSGCVGSFTPKGLNRSLLSYLAISFELI